MVPEGWQRKTGMARDRYEERERHDRVGRRSGNFFSQQIFPRRAWHLGGGNFFWGPQRGQDGPGYSKRLWLTATILKTCKEASGVPSIFCGGILVAIATSTRFI